MKLRYRLKSLNRDQKAETLSKIKAVAGYNYFAQDYNGEFCGFAEMPTFDGKYWRSASASDFYVVQFEVADDYMEAVIAREEIIKLLEDK